MDCGRVDYGDDEAASIPPASVIISSSNTELKDELHISRKVDDVDDDDDVDDVDRQSEGSGVMESSVSDDTSLPTDGSTDTADPCGRGV